jgi:adenine-specific DNA-methyltransferase
LQQELEKPRPDYGELPTMFADRIGRWCTAKSESSKKKAYGQFLTPADVARYMAAQSSVPNQPRVSILDPGAGVGILACALCESIALNATNTQEIELTVYELDDCLIEPLRIVLENMSHWLTERNIKLIFFVVHEDFVKINQTLFTDIHEVGYFDFIICNPPYFKLNQKDPRTQAAERIVSGQSNIYALFLFLCAKLLAVQGEVISITPRSFANGHNFRLFRNEFFSMIEITRLHLFHSRSKAFERDDVLQETVIMSGRRHEQQNIPRGGHLVRVSSSVGVSDLDQAILRTVQESIVIDMESQTKIMRIPFSEAADEVAEIIDAWTSNLTTYNLTVTTGKVVPYEVPSYMSMTGDLTTTHAPLLWMQHVTTMNVTFPIAGLKKSQYLRLDVPLKSFIAADRVYILIRRCSFKERDRKVIASPLDARNLQSDQIALENHLNCIYSENNSLDLVLAYGLSALLNSTLLDVYLKAASGTTQINANELRQLPLPARERIEALGRAVLEFERYSDTDSIDVLVKRYILEPENEAIVT